MNQARPGQAALLIRIFAPNSASQNGFQLVREVLALFLFQTLLENSGERLTDFALTCLSVTFYFPKGCLLFEVLLGKTGKLSAPP